MQRDVMGFCPNAPKLGQYTPMKSPELLLPAGSLDKMRAAYDFGADAVAGQLFNPELLMAKLLEPVAA